MRSKVLRTPTVHEKHFGERFRGKNFSYFFIGAKNWLQPVQSESASGGARSNVAPKHLQLFAVFTFVPHRWYFDTFQTMSSIPASDNDVSSSVDGKGAVDLGNKSVTVDKKRKVRADEDEESGDFNEESMPGDDDEDDEDDDDEDVDDEDGNDPEEHDDSDDDNQETVIILIGAKFLTFFYH